MAIRPAMAYGEEQSMRILPSQSSDMKRKVGSGWLCGHGHLETVTLGDAVPIGDAGAAERVGADGEAGVADGFEVEHRAEIVHVGPPGSRSDGWSGAARALAKVQRRTSCSPAASMALARFSIHLVAAVSAGPPLGGLYLKPPSSGGLCDGVMTMPSASPVDAAAIVRQDGVGERGGGGVAEVLIDHHLDAVGREHLERRGEGGLGERVRILAEEERAVDAVFRAILADRLRDGEDVGLVEGGIRRSEPRCPEVPKATRCAGTEGSGFSV